MAFMPSLSISTHNLYQIAVNLLQLNHRMPTIRHEEPQIPYFDGLVELIPQLITISSSACFPAFYDDSIHSMECRQCVRPAIFVCPEFSPLAVALGSVRCPELINW